MSLHGEQVATEARCGTAAGAPGWRREGIGGISVVLSGQADEAAALSHAEVAPRVLGNAVAQDFETIRRLSSIPNVFFSLAIQPCNEFAGVVEAIQLSAAVERLIIRIRPLLTLNAMPHRREILGAVVAELFGRWCVDKIVVFTAGQDDTEEFLDHFNLGFREEGWLADAEYRDGAWRDVIVLGLSRKDFTE